MQGRAGVFEPFQGRRGNGAVGPRPSAVFASPQRLEIAEVTKVSQHLADPANDSSAMRSTSHCRYLSQDHPRTKHQRYDRAVLDAPQPTAIAGLARPLEPYLCVLLPRHTINQFVRNVSCATSASGCASPPRDDYARANRPTEGTFQHIVKSR